MFYIKRKNRIKLNIDPEILQENKFKVFTNLEVEVKFTREVLSNHTNEIF